jgi:hypothetical protein
MTVRRSEYDVTNQVDTTDPRAVHQQVSRLFERLYPGIRSDALPRAFEDCTRLYRGEYPGYRACDTAYHNLQHTLDVALAMARLMDGYERAPDTREALGPRLFVFGVVSALFHDIGYLRHVNDTRHRNGAEYTTRHVSRGSRFLEPYMGSLGMADLASQAASILHFTGYEVPVNEIKVAAEIYRTIGNLLGTADILAQMSDRCYLEKCRDRLYPEFVAGGLAHDGHGEPGAGVAFLSAEDLLRKTPGFYTVAQRRLTELLDSAFRYARAHFGGDDPYLAEVTKNIEHARRLAREPDVLQRLRRRPPPRFLVPGLSPPEVSLWRAATAEAQRRGGGAESDHESERHVLVQSALGA